MLPKREKLSAAEVREILKGGRTLRTAHLVAKYKESPSGKAAVVVSKKIARSAVERNRLRRAIYKTLKASLPAHTHLVLMVQKKTDNFSSDIKTVCSKLS